MDLNEISKVCQRMIGEKDSYEKLESGVIIRISPVCLVGVMRD